MVTFKKLETLGGIGSMLAGVGCVAIGWMDYETGQSWHIWAVMFLVLMLNGVLMLVSASRRAETPLQMPRRNDIEAARNTF